MLFNHQFLLQLALQSVLLIHHRVQDSIHLGRIKFLLKQQPSTYIVIKNETTNSSLCWKVFGFPAKNLENTNQYE